MFSRPVPQPGPSPTWQQVKELFHCEHAEKGFRWMAMSGGAKAYYRQCLRAYLDSPEWAERRRLVLDRDEHRCQARLEGCLGRASQVHHLTYAHCQLEPLFDLVAVCRLCHVTLTRMDRERRSAA